MTEEEFTEIVRTTKNVVLTAIHKNLSARFYHAIDDVAQETYLRAYKNLTKNKFRGDSKIGSWLYTIARNEALRMNSRLVKEEEKFKKAIHTFEDRENSAADRHEEDIHVLHDSIGRLPDKYREVLELVLNGLSVNEIAMRLNIKNGTVKSRTSRGREMLQKIMAGGEI